MNQSRRHILAVLRASVLAGSGHAESVQSVRSLDPTPGCDRSAKHLTVLTAFDQTKFAQASLCAVVPGSPLPPD